MHAGDDHRLVPHIKYLAQACTVSTPTLPSCSCLAVVTSCNAGRGKKLLGPKWVVRWSAGEQGLQMGHVGSPLSPSLPESPASRHSTSESGSAAKLKPLMLAGLCCVAAAEPAQQSLVTQSRLHMQPLCIPIF